MNFQLDTTGDVGPMPAGPINEQFLKWSDLSPFVQGYVEALFHDAHWHGFFGRKTLRPEECRFDRLAPETLAWIIVDCRRYARGFDLRKTDEGQREQGRRLWTRQQAGNLPGLPPLTIQLGDDGKVRFAA